MLNSLHFRNFTAFQNTTFGFGRNLNVVVGENGMGKTHILKAAYCGVSVLAEGAKKSESAEPSKSYLQSELARKFKAVFRPDRLGRLATRKAGHSRCEVGYDFSAEVSDYAFSFATKSDAEVELIRTPGAWIKQSPVYLPTRELLTLQPQFIPIYDEKYLPFEETWRDTSHLLGLPAVRGPREAQIKKILEPLEAVLGGRVTVIEGRFYLETPSGEFEMYLVAEGLRKLAMLAQLIATGALADKGYLFWDEPEANLNPKTIRLVAQIIWHLAQSGVQVFVATHSLFLLRELHILQNEGERCADCRYFALSRGADGLVAVGQGGSIVEIGDITALSEDIGQSDRYLKMAVEAAARSRKERGRA